MIRYTTRAWERRVHLNSGSSLADTNRVALPQSRQWALGGAIALIMVSLTARLAYWQLVQGATLSRQALAQQQQVVFVPSARGMILDRHGEILAVTVTQQAIILDPWIAQASEQQHPGTLAAMADRLATLTGLPVAVIQPQLTLATGYHQLSDGTGQVVLLSPDGGDAATAAIARGTLPGVVLRAVTNRIAPVGDFAGPVLGFVSQASGRGQYGVEQQYDTLLQGTVAPTTQAVDAEGNPLPDPGAANGATLPGATITLTLDTAIQMMAEQGLRQAVTQTQADGGTVLVIDPATGAILALATTPGFDPSHYADAPLSAFSDPAIGAVYDPGSTMKAVTMAAGLDSGVITPNTTLDDQGFITVGGQTIYNWDHLAWGTETMTQVLAHSSNVGAAWVATQQLGPARFQHYVAAFGLGTPTGVDLPGEVGGLLPPPATTADLNTLNLAENAFGESIGVTPLQMAMVYATIANGGVLMRPHIVQSITRAGHTQTLAPQAVRRVISAQSAATLTQMLVDSGLYGDAQTGLIAGYPVAAKTGTSTPDPADPTITYASVLGYAPASNPRFVLLVKLDHPRTTVLGGAAAGPLWRALTRQIMSYEQAPSQEGNA